jgi:hypothetical protein
VVPVLWAEIFYRPERSVPFDVGTAPPSSRHGIYPISDKPKRCARSWEWLDAKVLARVLIEQMAAMPLEVETDS